MKENINDQIKPLWKLLMYVEDSDIYVVKCLKTGKEKAFFEKPLNMIDYILIKNDIPNDYNATLQAYANFNAELELMGKTLDEERYIKEFTKCLKNQNKIMFK